jgi:hypothetical protein
MNKSSLLHQGLVLLLCTGFANFALAADPETKVKAADDADDNDDDTSGTLNLVEPEFAVTQNGQKLKHSCKEGAPMIVNIIGNNNTLTIDGECVRLVVTGNNNKVTIEAVGEITALGDGLDVTYKRGLAGKEPKITKVGEKIRIVKVKK